VLIPLPADVIVEDAEDVVDAFDVGTIIGGGEVSAVVVVGVIVVAGGGSKDASTQ
jgi:hypothetical protein